MRIKTIFTKTVVILGLFYLFACRSAEPTAALPDPSAVHCIKLGGKLKPLRAQDGSESLLCVLVDREVDTWALFYETHPKQGSDLLLLPEK
jgi:putative hemolysin